MLATDILLPVFVHVALVFGVLLVTGFARQRAVSSGRTEWQKNALGDHWPDETRASANNFRNQFEVPVLFYVLVAFLLITTKADLVQVVLAWIFVLSRILHTVIHLGSNVVLRRGMVFFVGVLVLLVMWVWFGLRLFILG
ncbi:MAG: MAPEG family protein [Parvibaculaceae bacterium]